ncbi:Uncharacterised protein [Vibrio cholerae]|nr:Uncharacterised protein [Vibrio cholerae]
MEFGDFGDHRGTLCDCLAILVSLSAFSDHAIAGGHTSRSIESARSLGIFSLRLG